MTSKAQLLIYSLYIALLVGMGSCKHDCAVVPEPEPEPPPTNPCDPDTVYFKNDILPLLLSSCGVAGCHDETMSAGIRLTDYESVIASDIVDPFDAEGSEMYRVITETDPDKRMPPPPRNPLGQDKIEQIRIWIEQGALDNACVGEECDTTDVTYPGSVVPIFEKYCLGCHSGATPSGNLDLTDYDQVAFIAENGILVGAIRHLPGYSAMPQGGEQLDECLIRTIEIWIEDTTFSQPEPPHPCDPDTVYFEKDLLPILQSACAQPGCHDATASDGIRLDSYAAVIASDIIRPDDPVDSEMYEVITETDPDKRMPPPPQDPLSDDRKQLILKWISQGGQNLFCDEDCDTTNVTFSGVIWPEIIETYCFGCHKNPNPLGGLKLENYSDVATIAANGKLLGVVTHSAGFPPMPKNAPKLDDCKITQITKWIDDGYPDN